MTMHSRVGIALLGFAVACGALAAQGPSERRGSPPGAAPVSGEPARVTPAIPLSPPAAKGEPESESWDLISAAFGGSPSDTRPSRDATMKFIFAVEIREIPVKAGDQVRRGDVMVRARDNDVVAAMDLQRQLAKNDLEIQGAKAAMELAAFRFEQLKRGGGFSPSEFEELRMNAVTTAVQWEQAKFNLEQQQGRLSQVVAQYERYRLEAPFDGIVEQIMLEVGQGVNEQEPALRVVNIDQLWLDTFAPTRETIQYDLKDGSKAWVLIDLPGRARLLEGKVLNVSPVADPVSGKRRVRVEVANPKGWPAGTLAQVRFDDPGEEWAAYRFTVPAERSGAGRAAGDQPASSPTALTKPKEAAGRD